MTLFVAATTFSQSTTNLNVSKSEKFNDQVKSSAVLSIHTTPSGLTGIIRNSKKNLLFDVFSESLGRIKNTLIPKDKNEFFYGDLTFNNIIKVFTVFSPSKRERIVYCHEFNMEDGTHKRTELFKTEVEKNQSIFSGKNKRETGFAISPRGTYFVVSTDDIKKHANSYTVRVYNTENLELIYELKYQENTEKFYEANDLSIDDEANVFALGKLYSEGRSQKKEGKANYDFVLNKISEDGVNTKTVDFDKKEHISSLIISNINDQMRLIGFYSEENAGRIKGTLLFNVDTGAMEISPSKSFELPEAVYRDLYNEEKAKRKKDKGKELTSYYVDYVLEDDTGNTYLLAEEFFITTVYVYTGVGAGYSQTVFHYNNVLVLKLNEQNELEWARSIFKRDTAPSYNAFIKNDELHVVLNSGKNLTEKDDGRVKVSKGWLESSSLYDIAFDRQGEVSYNKIQDNKGNLFFTPFYGVYNADRFITIGRKGSERQFLILE